MDSFAYALQSEEYAVAIQVLMYRIAVATRRYPGYPEVSEDLKAAHTYLVQERDRLRTLLANEQRGAKRNGN